MHNGFNTTSRMCNIPTKRIYNVIITTSNILRKISYHILHRLSFPTGYNTPNKCVIEETGLKVDCFVGFFHHPVTTMSAFTHAHHHPLFESGIKTGL